MTKGRPVPASMQFNLIPSLVVTDLDVDRVVIGDASCEFVGILVYFVRPTPSVSALPERAACSKSDAYLCWGFTCCTRYIIATHGADNPTTPLVRNPHDEGQLRCQERTECMILQWVEQARSKGLLCYCS